MAIRFKSTDLVVQGNRLLRLYSYYSLFLALLLMIVDSADRDNVIVGSDYPAIFLAASSLYIIVAAIFAVIANRSPDTQIATSYMFIEIALLSALMLSSGGLEGGFSSLILIPLTIANLLAPGILGYGVAAWTTIAVLYTLHIWPNNYDTQYLVNSGLYGMLCFVLAWVTQTLSRRLNSALSLASDQATRIRRLQRFSKQALLDLPNGIIACDRHDDILFFNTQALRWFNIEEGKALPQRLMNMPSDTVFESKNEKLIIKRVELNGSEPGDYLIYAENAARISAEAQHFKLASLGRLTASIAHEIRNPLSALRQAAQLLAETPDMKEPEQQLTRIIEQQCMRINRTIEDVLQLSRRHLPTQEVLRLSPWLQHFANQFRSFSQDKTYQLNIHCPDDARIKFDPDQLQQVLHNLCANGLRYALQANGDRARLIMIVTINDLHNIQLDIIDNGNGVAAEQRAHLFEPFYTTEHSGTGLGLYLCRELCEANQAQIQYHPIPNGTCFRIIMKSA
ncbi:MAG: HAMP domain-containing histidine kinase [Pseudomonadota bacterium]|nr:HAMP domain-containing histidine kinase [Pseudomonadota bacterium]